MIYNDVLMLYVCKKCEFKNHGAKLSQIYYINGKDVKHFFFFWKSKKL